MMNIEKTWQALMLMKDDMSASETERENAVRLLKKFDKVKVWTDQTKIADEVLSLPDLSNNALNLIRSVLTMKCRDVAVVFYEKQNEFHAYGDPSAVLVIKTFCDYATKLCTADKDSKNVAVFEQVLDLLVLQSDSMAIVQASKKNLYSSLQSKFDAVPQYVTAARTGKRDKNFALKQMREKPFNFTKAN